VREDLLLTSGHPLIGTVGLLLKLAIVNKFGLPLPSGASRRTRAPTRYSRREAWLRSDVIRALLARAVPCFPAVLYIYRFLSVRLPWWRWVQLSRVSSLTASRSSFDCLASSREAHASAAEAAGRQQIGESLEPQQIADPEPGLAELDALMNSMTRQEEMAFQAWREQRGHREYQCRHF